MSDIAYSDDYIVYSADMVSGIGVAGPPVVEAQSSTEGVTENVDVNSEGIDNYDEDIGQNVDVTV